MHKRLIAEPDARAYAANTKVVTHSDTAQRRDHTKLETAFITNAEASQPVPVTPDSQADHAASVEARNQTQRVFHTQRIFHRRKEQTLHSVATTQPPAF